MSPNLDHLKAERAKLSARLSEVMAARTRLKAAEGDEAKIIQAIGDLGRDEIDALRDWVKSGAGPRPVPNVEGRKQLQERLVEAQIAAEAARGLHADLDVEQREISEALTITQGMIEDLALDELARRHEAERRNLDAWIAERLIPRMALGFALHSLLIEKARIHQAAGREDPARKLFQRAEALRTSSTQLNVDPAPGQIVENIGVWSERFDELIADHVRAEAAA